jgi:NAD(P)-dependent dehydrogenase (short-subunit alcohol dehydrogenase family)
MQIDVLPRTRLEPRFRKVVAMSLVALIKGRSGESGFGHASTAEEVTKGIDLTGQCALITGVNSGLGKETARVLALRGAHIIGVARTIEKSSDACIQIGPDTTAVACELSDPASVVACVNETVQLGRPIDMLICNAGIMALPKLQQKHGIERQFFTNHIGHFGLVTGLLDSLSASGRVVVLSSYAHKIAPREGIQFENLSGESSYWRWRAYGQSKLANLLFAVELARRFEGTQRSANAVHPGVIRTNLNRHLGSIVNTLYATTAPIFSKTVAQGAATSCYVATNPQITGLSGEYFANCNLAKTSRHGKDAEMAKRLWEVSEEILAQTLTGY